MRVAAPCSTPSFHTYLMTRPARLPVLLAASLLLVSCGTVNLPRPADPGSLTILISLDGFRWDYLDRYEAPTLRALAVDGVRMRSLTPSFPTKTFPNHYTLVTGLRPAHHGIVGNWFYDPESGETFGMSKAASNTEQRWWGGEPLWITAERQGVRSACYFWPGSEAAHDGLRPSRWLPFNDSIPSPERVDGLLRWLEVPAADRPKFATLYFSAVDHAGHRHGPDAPELQAAITEVDGALARLLAGLARLGLRERTNLIIVSDHGMSPQSPDRVVFLEDLVDVRTVEIETTGTYAGLRPRPGTRTPDELAAAIRARAPRQVQVYTRDTVPARYEFSGNARIPAVVLLADDQWNIEEKRGWGAKRATYNKGGHGWDHRSANMGGLFVAAGPAFPRGKLIGPFDNIHVYNLVCAILGLKPAPNDGDDRLARAALRR